MRAYQNTITWLTYRVEVRKAPPAFWLQLGQLIAGLKHLNGVPLATAEARAVERDLVVRGVGSRLALDGLILPFETIRSHLSGGAKPGARAADRAEVSGFLSSLVGPGSAADPRAEDLSPEGLKWIHSTLFPGASDQERPGHWRIIPTGGRPWEGVPHEVVGLFTEELCDWLKSAELAAPAVDEEQAWAVIRMLLAELYLFWIRPFTTGHARVAGAFGARVLHKAGMGPNAAHLLAIALHRNGAEWQRQLQHAAEGNADPTPFLAFAVRAMNEVLREVHARVRDLQMRGQWRAQLLELFQDGNDEPTRRQRQVLLDLASADTPVPLNGLSILSPALAKLYAGVSEKTLRRDVDALLQAGVLQREPEGLRVDLTNILAFKEQGA
jgi:Fic family protein